MRGGRVFISYRRDDSRADSGRLYDRLATYFPGRVFRDVGSIEPGVAASVERPAGGGVPPTGSPRLVSSSKRITPMGRPGSMLDALRAWDGSAAGVQAPTLGRRDYQLGKPNGYGCLTC